MKRRRLLSMVISAVLGFNLILPGIPALITAAHAAEDYILTDIIHDQYDSITDRAGLEAAGYTITPNPGTATNDVTVLDAGAIANPSVNNDKTGHVLYVKDTDSGDSKFVRTLPSPLTGLVTVEFDWRIEKTGMDSHGYKVIRLENTDGQALLELRLSDSGANLSQYLYGASSNKRVVQGYQKDVWYQIRLEVDTMGKKAQAFARAGASGNFSSAGVFEFSETAANSAAEISRIAGFTTSAQTSSMYYDNLKVYTKAIRPAAPVGLVAEAGDAQAILSWIAAEGMSYTVKRSETNGGPYTEVRSGLTAGSYLDQGLMNGTTYYYVVSAVSGGLESADSAQAEATPQKPQPPSVPTGLTASPQNGQVVLNWNAVDGGLSYTVKYAAVSGGPYTSVPEVLTNSYTVTGLTNQTAYYFTVSAVNAVGSSGNAAEVQAVPVQSPPPVAPVGVKATASDSKITVSWNAVTGATGYNVKMSTDGQSFAAVAADIAATNYAVAGLTNGLTYYFVVTAVNLDGESVSSAVVSAAPVPLDAFSPVLSKTGGWLETAYVEWAPVSNAQGYNVYVKPLNADDSGYVQIDTQLIRQYPANWRADAVGLAAGDYVLKVEAVLPDGTRAASVSDMIAVEKHDRSGFAFAANSTFKTGSGAYNDDGTLRPGAQVIYVTPETAKTVTLDVITSSKGAVTKGTGIGNILSLRQKGYDTTPLAIRFIGKVTASDMSGQLNSSGYLEVKGKSNYTEMNVTLEGIGEDAYAYGWGFLVRYAGNAEIRNMGIMLFPDDGISLDTGNANVWLHNNDLFYGTAGGDADQAKGDGSTDLKGGSTFITFSYNHYWDSGKSALVGLSEPNEFFVTLHHNWFDHSDSRHPRVRRGTIHVYNNYFDGVAKYGVGATMGSSIFVESNLYRNAKYPMMISLQGTDIKDGVANGTFSGEAGGMIKAYGNLILDAGSLIYANSNAGTAPANPTSFDAYLAASRSEAVPSHYVTLKGGTSYNNFDTLIDIGVNPADIHPADQVEQAVTAKAGRMNNGDFTWTFNNAVDDASYSMNIPLMNKIRSYTSSIVSIGGNSTDPVIPVPVVPAAPASVTADAGNAKVALTWNASQGAVSYTVKRSTSANGTYTAVASNLTGTAYTDTSVANGTTYYYVVMAVNTVGESQPSAQVSAAPAAPVGDKPVVTLSHVDPVAPGESFTTRYGLSNIVTPVYAQDMTFRYDSTKLEFVSAKSLKSGFSIVKEMKEVPGQVRLLAASFGQTAAVTSEGPLVELTWVAKGGAQTVALTASDVKLSGSTGIIQQAAEVSLQIQIQGAVDWTALQTAVARAEAYLSSAVTGTKIGQYPAAAKSDLTAAIAAAQTVASNSASTQQQADQALTALNAAVDTFLGKAVKPVAGQVDIGDLGILGAAYGLKAGDEGWNANLDFIPDGVIDIQDLVYLANWIM